MPPSTRTRRFQNLNHRNQKWTMKIWLNKCTNVFIVPREACLHIRVNIQWKCTWKQSIGIFSSRIKLLTKKISLLVLSANSKSAIIQPEKKLRSFHTSKVSIMTDINSNNYCNKVSFLNTPNFSTYHYLICCPRGIEAAPQIPVVSNLITFRNHVS